MKTRILLSHRARRVFVWAHLWLGLILGAWFSLIGISGSVLTWRTELGAWELSRKYPVATPSENAPLISLAQATGSLQREFPDFNAREIASIGLPTARAAFYNFTIGRNRRTARQILVDPYSARILGTVTPRTGTVATIQQFHQRLIAGARGYAFNGFLSVMAIPLLLSGLWLWWPNNAPQLRARLSVKRAAPLHRKIYDWHNFFGIYLYSLLFMTTVTGALLVKNHIDRDGWAKTWQELKAGEAPPQRGGERGAARPNEGAGRAAKVTPQGAPLPIDVLVQKARLALPNREITRLQLPGAPDAALEANYTLPTGFATNARLFLDPYTGETISSKNGTGVNANQVVRGLHLGDFGGVAIKMLYTLSGLMPLGLFGSGVWLWARKKLRAKNKVPRENAAPAVSNVA